MGEFGFNGEYIVGHLVVGAIKRDRATGVVSSTNSESGVEQSSDADLCEVERKGTVNSDAPHDVKIVVKRIGRIKNLLSVRDKYWSA